ncbi:orotate phosphoribosyltransferase [Candidatus Micrarchaeota archaeon]|nr:orotate phosphoribosyltransferase [Candidatus Micrarchaeota archaeon]
MNSEFIEYLAKNNVLKFGDFTTKSGRKTPYFITTGVLFSGKSISGLGHFFAKKIKELFGNEFDTIFGPAYKGIPLAVATAIALDKDFKIVKTWLFDRKEVKEHGDKGAFVGDGPRDDQRIIMVDDVFTTGGTKEDALRKLKSVASVDVKAIVIAVDREERGNTKNAIKEFEEELLIRVHAIEKISNVFTYLHNREIDGKIYVDDELLAAFKEYEKQYGAKYE